MNGLEENSLYTVQIEFRVADSYKYRFINGEWRTSPRTEKISPKPILYEHSDSPNFGHHWAKDSIAFSKLKLTNNENSKTADAVYLKSLMKYSPIIHVYRHDKKNVDDKVLVFSQLFRETQFIAVTAYQNEAITSLKIKFNPFAKAFLNNNKPFITIENNAVTTNVEPKKQQVQASFENQTKPNFQIDAHASKKEENNSPYQVPILHKPYVQPDFIQNWYAARYSLGAYNQPTYVEPQVKTNTQYNPYGYDYNAHFNNQYFYPQANYDFNSTNFATRQMYPYQFQSYDNVNQLQYSPINSQYTTASSGKRSHETMCNEQNEQSYDTRSSKRSNNNTYEVNSLQNDTVTQQLPSGLPISPVYNFAGHYSPLTKLEYTEPSDDSNNSTDNFLAANLVYQQPCQDQSASNSSNSSYTNVYQTTKHTNESGYYSQSPSSIASILEAQGNIQNGANSEQNE